MKQISIFIIIFSFMFSYSYGDNDSDFNNWKKEFKIHALNNKISEKTFEDVDRKYNLPTVKVKDRKRVPKNSIHLKDALVEIFKLNNNNFEWKSNIKIKDGNYKIGIRPHNITTYKEGNNSLEINGKVLISELSGSESLIHFTNGNLNWVSLSNGIQQKNIGEETKLYMNIYEYVEIEEDFKRTRTRACTFDLVWLLLFLHS